MWESNAPDEFEGAHATNPGQVDLELGTYFAAYPMFLIIGLGIIGMGILMIVVSGTIGLWPGWLGFIPVFVGFSVIFSEQKIMAQWMFYGATQPAVVVSPEESLIAVFADMAMTGHRSHPAIRILKVPLQKTAGVKLREGARLPTVCTFRDALFIGSNFGLGSLLGDHWVSVSPIPVGCATTNLDVIDERLESIDDDDWIALRNGLQMIEHHRPGLYFLNT